MNPVTPVRGFIKKTMVTQKNNPPVNNRTKSLNRGEFNRSQFRLGGATRFGKLLYGDKVLKQQR